MYKTIVNIVMLLSLGCSAFSQLQPLLDQYHLNGLAINPAYAGSKEALAIGLYARNQWVGFEGAPKTFTYSMHSPMRNKKVNLGLIVLTDRIGSRIETGINLNYAYRMDLGRGKLAFGLGAGITRVSNDPNCIRYNDENDALLNNLSEIKVLPNFSFGSYYYENTYYLGFSIPQMATHNLDEVTRKYNTVFNPSTANYILTGGYLHKISDTFEIFPSALLKTNPNHDTQLDVNCNVIYKEIIGLGAGVRTNGNISSMLHLQVNPQLRIGYSYGYEISKLSSFQNGSHEIMLLYNFRFVLDVLSPRYF